MSRKASPKQRYLSVLEYSSVYWPNDKRALTIDIRQLGLEDDHCGRRNEQSDGLGSILLYSAVANDLQNGMTRQVLQDVLLSFK